MSTSLPRSARGRWALALAVAVPVAGLVLAACAPAAPTRATVTARTFPARPSAAGATGSTPPPSTARDAAALPPGAISTRLAGVPATIPTGGPALEFTATLTNHSDVDAPDVAPLFQIVGGPCNCALGTLQRLDAATGAWQSAPMPEGDGDPDFLAAATGGINLAPGASATIRYRLTLAAANPAKSVIAILYAVELPDATELAHSSAPSRLVNG